ncbi:hypothetical protein NVP1074O_55 [Vibrio phage 1.074.O._10N.222.49.B7]|nr:hypothetical protein NVP1074O_55 [Vibrio phage 1.074.O._10N.222.49.B7]
MYKLAKFRADLRGKVSNKWSRAARAELHAYASAKNGRDLDEKLYYADAYRVARRITDEMKEKGLL